MLISNLPRQTGTPIMADEVEPAIAVSDGLHDVERVADQMIDPVTGIVGRVRPSGARVAALIGRHGKIAGLGHCTNLGVPEEP